MKLSSETQVILKNFSGINSNLVVRAGKSLRTFAVTKSVLAIADVSEEFPDFAIYDLNEFLGALSLFKEPDLEFEQDHLIISGEGRRLKYYFASPSTFKVLPPEQEIKFPSPDVSFTLTQAQLNSLQKAAAVLKLDEVAVVGDGQRVSICAIDHKNPTANSFDVELDATSTAQFQMIFKVDNLRLLAGDYQVDVSSTKKAQFTNQQQPIKYYVACETASKFVG